MRKPDYSTRAHGLGDPPREHLAGARDAIGQMRRQVERAEREKGDCENLLFAMFNAWRLHGIADAHLGALPWTQAYKRPADREAKRLQALTARWHRVFDTKVHQCTRK